MSFERLDCDQAAAIVDELTGLYREVYAEPPYGWGEEHAALFRERFAGQRRVPGFALVTARVDGELVGFTFGGPCGRQPRGGRTWWNRCRRT